MKCPICKEELVTEHVHAGPMGVEESLYTCHNCREYSERFAYGATDICVGRFEAHMHYTQDEAEVRVINRGVQLIGALYRRRLGL